MSSILVVDDPGVWKMDLPNVEVVAAWDYLTDPVWSDKKAPRVFNLCSSYRYQTVGYYVSLLAAARGHTPIPSLSTVLDMRSKAVLRIVDDDLDELIDRSLARLKSDRFELSIYFGKNPAARYDRLCARLFAHFHAPFVRARFSREGSWHLASISPISSRRIPKHHWDFVLESARAYLGRRAPTQGKKPRYRYDLALLLASDDPRPPSNEGALRRFTKAAEALGIGVDRITKDHLGRLSEYDALFIRETTAVNHHTFRFAQQAEAAGLVAVDDPQSIIRCGNKVYLAELLTRKKVPIPRTVIGHRANVGDIANLTGFPCVLKFPDSSFSQGVVKVESLEDLQSQASRILETSDLFVAQEWLPTAFDWRVGIFDRSPLWVCRYHMAKDHWQIIKKAENQFHFGRVEAVPVEQAPPAVVKTALRAANLIGEGLYGVDLKQTDKDIVVIEINDNPNIDASLEDKVLGTELYRRMAAVFLKRIEALKLRGGH